MLGTKHVEVFCHRVGKRTPCLQHGIHVGDLALDELELANALSKLLAVMGVRNHVVHDRLHDAQRPARQHGALIVQAAHQHLGAHIQAAQNILCRHFDILEHEFARMAAAHSEFVEFLRDRKSLHALFDQKSRDPARTQLRLSLGVDHQRVGVGAIGDPHLVAIEQVVATLVLGLELHADDIGARAWLTHCQRTHMFAADELGQVFLLLLSCPVAIDLVDAQIAVRSVAQAHRSRCARNLFHGHHVGQVTHVGAAMFFRHRDAQHTKIAHLAPQIHGKLVGVIDLRSAWGDFRLCEITHGITQSVDVIAQLKVEARKVAGNAHGVLLC